MDTNVGGVVYWREKWEGLENEDNRDIGKYEGEIKNGFPNGQGTYTWSDGDKEVGEWKKNELWNGTMYDKDGNIIKRVVNGVKQ